MRRRGREKKQRSGSVRSYRMPPAAPQQTLSRALAAGEYSAVLKYECFADEAETGPLNGSEIALTLRVQ